MPADIIVYAIIAAGLVFWLRNILGTQSDDDPRAGSSAPPLRPLPPLDDERPIEGMALPLSAEEQIARLAAEPSGPYRIENKTAEMGLNDIARADRSFNIRFFLEGAQEAFVMIVEAFAKGDRATLSDLLDPAVYQAFEQAIRAQEEAGETRMAEVQAVRYVDVTGARLEGKRALVTLRIEAEQVSVTRDRSGAVVDGHPDKPFKMRDVWVFGRDVKSRDPRWFLVETRSDLEDDNTQIPNTH